MSGHEIAKNIRIAYPKIHIIAQTAYASEEDKEEALNAGCHDYIAKPIQRNEILEKMQKI